MRYGLIVTALLAGLAATPAAAAPWSAGDLREACGDDDAYYAYGACAGYLTAVLDQHQVRFGPASGLCVPPGTSYFEIGDRGGEVVVGLGVVDGESGVDLALRALMTIFPCE